MIKEIYLDNAPCTLQVTLRTGKAEKIWLKISNADKEYTYYTKRYCKINGTQSLFVRMPLAPQRAFIIIYNDNTYGYYINYHYDKYVFI